MTTKVTFVPPLEHDEKDVVALVEAVPPKPFGGRPRYPPSLANAGVVVGFRQGPVGLVLEMLVPLQSETNKVKRISIYIYKEEC